MVAITRRHPSEEYKISIGKTGDFPDKGKVAGRARMIRGGCKHSIPGGCVVAKLSYMRNDTKEEFLLIRGFVVWKFN